jgi:hypothetical protein
MDSATNNNNYLVTMNSYTTSKGKIKKPEASNEQQYPNLLVGGEKRKGAYKKGGAVGPNLL